MRQGLKRQAFAARYVCEMVSRETVLIGKLPTRLISSLTSCFPSRSMVDCLRWTGGLCSTVSPQEEAERHVARSIDRCRYARPSIPPLPACRSHAEGGQVGPLWPRVHRLLEEQCPHTIHSGETRLSTHWRTPHGAYAVGEVFPFTYQGRPYDGRVIERHVSRAEGLVELHVQAAGGEEQAPSNAPAHAESDGVHGWLRLGELREHLPILVGFTVPA